MADDAACSHARFDIRATRQILLEDCCTEVWQSLLEEQDYLDWKAGRSQGKLCIYAAPQCGKTTFAAAVAEVLELDGTVVSIFLDPQDNVNNFALDCGSMDDSINTFRYGILEQLSGSAGSTRTAVLPLTEVQAYLRTQADQIENKFLILDGYDSCSTSLRQMLDEESSDLISQGYRVLILRTQWSIPPSCDACNEHPLQSYRHCQQCLTEYDLCYACFNQGMRCPQPEHRMYETCKGVDLDMKADLVTYLDREIDNRLRDGEYDRQLVERLSTDRDRVRGDILNKARGRFAICKALIDHLRDEQTSGLDEITQLHDRVSLPLAEYFDEVFRRVKQQAWTQSHTAMNALYAVSQASKIGRSTNFYELSDMLSKIPETDRIGHTSELIRICHGLIDVHMDSTVQFFDPSVQTFLVENCEDDFRALRMDLTALCLEFLETAPRFSVWDADSEQSLRAFYRRCPFAAYAARTWGFHLATSLCYRGVKSKDSMDTKSNTAHALKLLRDDQWLASVLYLGCISCPDFDLWPGCHPYHVCARFGLTKLIPLLKKCPLGNYSDPVYLRTPFVIAAVTGQYAFVENFRKVSPASILSRRDISKALLEVLKSVRPMNDQMLDLLLSHLSAIPETEAAPDSLAFGTPLVTTIVQDKNAERPQTNPAAAENTPLIYAIGNDNIGSYNTCKKLATHQKIDINEQIEDGTTALHSAVYKRDLDIIQLLLEQPGLNLRLTDKMGKTAIHYAAEYRTPDIIRFLISHEKCDANTLNICDTSQRPAIMLIFENFELEDVDDETLDVLEAFRRAGADFHCRDKNGRGLLHAAAEKHQSFAFEYLLEQGLHIDDCDHNQWSPLHIACCVGGIESARKLIELGANPQRLDDNEWTPAGVATLYGHDGLLDSVEALKFAKGRRNFTNTTKPFWSLAFTDPKALLEFDQERQIAFNASDPFYGNTALHIALQVSENEEDNEQEWNGHVLKHLICQTNVEIPNGEGKTSLGHAIISGDEYDPSYVEVIHHLLLKGADPDQILPTGESLVDAARRRRKWKAAIFLIQHSKSNVRLDLDFDSLLRAAISSNNIDAVEKLINPELRALRRFSGRLASAFAQDNGASDTIVQSLKNKERTALRQLWSV